MTTPSVLAAAPPWPAQSLLDTSTLPGDQLAAHQLAAVEWMAERGVAVLADPTGAGKTATACGLLAHLMEWDGAERVLWVTEAHLVQQTLAQLRRFLPAVGSAAWPASPNTRIAVASYGLLTSRLDQAVAFAPDVVLLDEASAVKNTGRRAEALAAVIARAWWRGALTATPMEVDAMELYRLLSLLGATRLPDEETFERFLLWQEYGNGERRAVGVHPGTLAQLRRVLSPFVLRREVHELDLDLPELDARFEWVKLTSPQASVYAAADRIWDNLRRSQMRERACMAVDGRSAKAEAAQRWLVSHPDVHKVLVWAENLEHLNVFERLLNEAGIGWLRIDGGTARSRRRDVTSAFRDDPGVRVLLGTRVLERGIDGLQHAEVLLSLGSSFNPAREMQRIGRLRRPGARHAVVRHVTFLTDTEHERRKAMTVFRRQEDAASVLCARA